MTDKKTANPKNCPWLPAIAPVLSCPSADAGACGYLDVVKGQIALTNTFLVATKGQQEQITADKEQLVVQTETINEAKEAFATAVHDLDLLEDKLATAKRQKKGALAKSKALQKQAKQAKKEADAARKGLVQVQQQLVQAQQQLSDALRDGFRLRKEAGMHSTGKQSPEPQDYPTPKTGVSLQRDETGSSSKKTATKRQRIV